MVWVLPKARDFSTELRQKYHSLNIAKKFQKAVQPVRYYSIRNISFFLIIQNPLPVS